MEYILPNMKIPWSCGVSMSRNNRLLNLGLILLLLIAFSLMAGAFPHDVNPDIISFSFLFLICLIYYLHPLRILDFILILFSLIPGIFFFYHYLSGMPVWSSLELILKCMLILSMYIVIFLFIDLFNIMSIKTILRLGLSLGMPVVSILFLLSKNILFLLLLSIFGGLFLYYRNKAKREGRNNYWELSENCCKKFP